MGVYIETEPKYNFGIIYSRAILYFIGLMEQTLLAKKYNADDITKQETDYGTEVELSQNAL